MMRVLPAPCASCGGIVSSTLSKLPKRHCVLDSARSRAPLRRTAEQVLRTTLFLRNGVDTLALLFTCKLLQCGCNAAVEVRVAIASQTSTFVTNCAPLP